MNKIIIIGNICAKPEAHTTQNGITNSRFTVAVQRKFKNADGNYDTDFLQVVAWRQTAEFCNQYLDKGRKVAVEGSLQTRSYAAQDGSKRNVVEIIAESVEAVGGRQEAAEKPVESKEQFTEVDDDELPWEK